MSWSVLLMMDSRLSCLENLVNQMTTVRQLILKNLLLRTLGNGCVRTAVDVCCALAIHLTACYK
jgi:hypothetical protein